MNKKQFSPRSLILLLLALLVTATTAGTFMATAAPQELASKMAGSLTLAPDTAVSIAPVTQMLDQAALNSDTVAGAPDAPATQTDSRNTVTTGERPPGAPSGNGGPATTCDRHYIGIVELIPEYTNMSYPDVRAAVTAGATLASLIEASGNSVDEFIARTLENAAALLAEYVAIGCMDQPQADKIWGIMQGDIPAVVYGLVDRSQRHLPEQGTFDNPQGVPGPGQSGTDPAWQGGYGGPGQAETDPAWQAGQHGQRPGPSGEDLARLAQILGLTESDLQARLDAGQRISEIAAELGIELTGPPNRIVPNNGNGDGQR